MLDGRVRSGVDIVESDPATGQVVAEIARTPEREGGGRVGLPPPADRIPGVGTLEHADVFMPSSVALTVTRWSPTSAFVGVHAITPVALSIVMPAGLVVSA